MPGKIRPCSLSINISLVDENDGVHVEVWAEFDEYSEHPPGLKEAINAWCKTAQVQDWALAQEAGRQE